ncbi:hypothetical protein TUM19329_31660 [Legionella antarctica]|uniref:Uncharacterized protein n=1 Tax=Legionella antarctica TaxID=2708020 RepID=A0A6F8T7Z9_9GAMM|nr:hypothetical protein [Legionella antarctica]BCA96805.1 hypothetical protein TUM19329_31660 [Legionella antarctica]
MPKNLYSKQEVLECAKKICSEINQQIPLASNRYRPSLEDEQNFDEELERAEVEYYLNKHITRLFNNYAQQNQLIDKEFSSSEHLNFIAMAIDSVGTVYEEIKIVNEILKKPVQVTLDVLRDNLKQTIDQKIKSLQNKYGLTISNKLLEAKYQFTKRMKLDSELVKHRKILKNQLVSIVSSYFQDKQEDLKDNDKLYENLVKLNHFAAGYHWDQTKCTSGYCGEHSSLALHKIFQSPLVFYVNRIEFITLDWLNNEGEALDNHVFIAINREPNSDLKDTKTWGQEAVLIDPWNQLVCYASKFHTIPDEYYDYSSEGKWDSVIYTEKDYDIYAKIGDDQKNYAITENRNIDKRSAIITDEYQLTSIDSDGYQLTRSLLLELAQKSRPTNFQTPIDFFITTCSNKLIMPILGLKTVGIAIHKDFFKLIEEGKASVDDLQIGVASTLYEILHHGLIGQQFRLDFNRFLECDRDLIAHNNCGDGLIHYLRLYHGFLKSYQEQDHKLENNLLDYLDVDKQQKAIEQRIKAITTMLASDEHVSKQSKEIPLPKDIANELLPLQFKTYFSQDFKTKKSIVDQLNYLTSCFADLKIELIPHELHRHSLTRRVREYCSLLESMHIDFNDEQQFIAVNRLIQQAYDARVPGFDQIYIALTKPKKDEYGLVDDNVRALGPFLKCLESLIKITKSSSYSMASTLASEFIDLWDNEFMKLFDVNVGRSVDEYIRDFYKIHKVYPTGNSRYFGSEIGTHIAIDNSVKNSGVLLKYMTRYSDQNIAKLFYILGNHSHSVLNTLSPDDLFALMHKYYDRKVDGFKFEYETQIHTFKHIISRKMLITDMFNSQLGFKDKIELFVKKNADLLTTPIASSPREPTCNFNGEATQFLLQQFTSIMQNGTADDKEVVKDFFLFKSNPNSLYYIQSRLGSHPHQLDYDSLFVQFIIEGRYQNSKVYFFSPKEKMEFYLSSGIFHGPCKLPAKQYIDLLNLNHETLTLESLTKIYNQLVQHDVRSYHPIWDLLEGHLKLVKPYTLLSADTQKLVALIQKTAKNSKHGSSPVRNFVKKIEWNLPSQISQLSVEQLKNLVYLYRAFNTCGTYPSLKDQLRYQQLLFEGIKQSSVPKQLELFELILFNQDFSEPISDFQFTKTLIDLFIAAAMKQYDVDDGSETYFQNIEPLLECIAKHVPVRDRETVFAKLLDRIQAQEKVCHFAEPHVHDLKIKTYRKNEQVDIDNTRITGLSALSLYFGEEQKDQQELIEFLSSSLSEPSLKQFTTFIMNHPKRDKILEVMGMNKESIIIKEDDIRYYNTSIYHHFWDVSLEERAVIFNHLLIPAQHTSSEKKEKEAYKQALKLVGKRLFPNAAKENSDDHFAMELLNSYLETSNKYQRGILLAGILVASNKHDNSTTLTTGKKIASLCEHMGPAYVKLAQAIHSYPGTPSSLRSDLAHVKGHASPLARWELWRLLELHVTQNDRAKIKYVGRLLGSASYNLALEVILQDDTKAVLILLREQAALNANKGFAHLGKTIKHCKHERMNSIREPMLSILSEAEKQSLVELDPVASQKQFLLAQYLYINDRFKFASDYDFDIKPAQYICGGDGYRIITKLEGTEFNELPTKVQDVIWVRMSGTKLRKNKSYSSIIYS